MRQQPIDQRLAARPQLLAVTPPVESSLGVLDQPSAALSASTISRRSHEKPPSSSGARPIYARTAAYGHFGRTPEADGGFSWERLDLVDDLKSALT